ncbi:MAG TPA: NUDIX domain-containing protein [Thermoanaerobaculia bacterium]|nr:NUDIX domain-containing protein [Thermoanaerobaculia bacterium]
MRRRSLTENLLAWFRSEDRRLPWRGTTDPYRIWVSEVMLQQTTVGAVEKRYEAFVARFPDVASLARAREESVLAAWSGLGYYARARNLRRAARIIRLEHGGRIPRDPAVLSSLPGFGDYMSAAVASLAFGARLPAAEANVERVLSRVFALPGTAGARELSERVLAHARALLPADRPGDFTAALMDLGQKVCTPRRPVCGACPIAADCVARESGDPESWPRRRAKPAPVRLSLAAGVAEEGGRLFLVRRRSTWLDGLWEFPCGEADSDPASRTELERRLVTLGLELTGEPALGTARHAVVNRRIEITVFRARRRGNAAPPGGARTRWFRPGDLADAAIPTLTRKVAAAARRSG